MRYLAIAFIGYWFHLALPAIVLGLILIANTASKHDDEYKR